MNPPWGLRVTDRYEVVLPNSSTDPGVGRRGEVGRDGVWTGKWDRDFSLVALPPNAQPPRLLLVTRHPVVPKRTECEEEEDEEEEVEEE